MSDHTAAIERALDEIGVPYERGGAGRWAAMVPATARRELTVGLAAGERTLRLHAFVMRGPDHRHADVYRRVLHKNLDLAATGPWRFGVDEHGDIHLAAEIPATDLDTAALDGTLGVLSALVDATFTGLVAAGFPSSADADGHGPPVGGDGHHPPRPGGIATAPPPADRS